MSGYWWWWRQDDYAGIRSGTGMWSRYWDWSKKNWKEGEIGFSTCTALGLCSFQFKSMSIPNSIINSIHQGNDPTGSFPQLSLPVLAGKVGGNWFHAYIKVPYLFSARNSFSLHLNLLGLEYDERGMRCGVSPWSPLHRLIWSHIHDENPTLITSSNPRSDSRQTQEWQPSQGRQP